MEIENKANIFQCYVGEDIYDSIPDIQQKVCQDLPFYAEFEGNQYCVLHHPSYEKEYDFNAEFEKRLTREEYDFRVVAFPSKINFSKLKCEKPVDFTYAFFADEADFSFTVFSKSVLFQATRFSDKVDFTSSVFLNEANFNSAIFYNKVNFGRADFGENSTASFYSTRFENDISFYSATIQGYIHFKGLITDTDYDYEIEKREGYLNRCFGQESYFNLEQTKIKSPEQVTFQDIRLHPSWFINANTKKITLINIQWENAGGTQEDIKNELEHLKKRQGARLYNPIESLITVYRQLALNAEENGRLDETAIFRKMITEAELLEKIKKADSKILSSKDKIWLKAIYEKTNRGEKINWRVLRIELKDKIPPDFTHQIPGGFLRGDRLTLLGIYLIDPESEPIRNADKVIQAIRELIEENPNVENITAQEISNIADLENDKVSDTLENLTYTGMFRARGTSAGSKSSYASIFIEDNTFNDYRRYGSIKDAFEGYISNMPYKTNEKLVNTTTIMQKEVNPRKVFVVHGRNEKARTSLFSFLRAIGLHPIEWSEAVKATEKGSPYIGEILDTAFSIAQAIIVLFTPDDEAKLLDEFISSDDEIYEKELTPQARPNVIFEAGMAMGRNPDRTILVELGKLRPFSDIYGRHVIRLNDTSKRRQELAHRLEAAGCSVNLQGTDWHDCGDFDSVLTNVKKKS